MAEEGIVVENGQPIMGVDPATKRAYFFSVNPATGNLVVESPAGGSDSVSIVSGGNTAAVKAASTPAVATDPALVVAVAPSAGSIAKAEDAASADGDVGIPAMVIQKATPADTGGTDGDYSILQMSGGRLWSSATVHATSVAGGIPSTARLPSAAASTNATNVKTTAGRIYNIQGKNAAAYDVFLVLYDSAANPPVPGTTTIRKKIPCPAGATFALDWPLGLSFASGIGYAFTKLVADADTTVLVAADIVGFNIDYA